MSVMQNFRRCPKTELAALSYITIVHCLSLGLSEEHMPPNDGVVLHESELLRHGAGVLGGGVEEAGASSAEQLDNHSLRLALGSHG